MSIYKFTYLCFLLLLISACKETPHVNPQPVAQPIKSEVVMTKKAEDITLDYCMGKFDPKIDERFDLITEPYATRAGMYLRKEAYEAYKKMYADAKKAGVILIVRSATRNFDYQRKIWENKWTGRTILSDGVNASADIPNEKSRAYKIMDYSAMPGASRHHWGTDIDVNSFNNKYFTYGKGLAIYNWMNEHAHEYGYCQPYTPKENNRSGYNEEKWHWSYTPLSTPITQYVSDHLHDDHFGDFLGFDTAKEIGVVQKYVLGIDKSCK